MLTGEYYSCEQCGTSVYRSPAQAQRVNHILCSVECKYAFRRGRKSPKQTGINHPRWTGSRFCKVCGKELFERYQRRKQNCGSEKCAHIVRSQAHAGSRNGRWLGGQVFCKQCGIEITRTSRLRATFCSRACGGKWNSENKSGANSHAWKGGKRIGVDEAYPPEWTPALRRSIRKRDGLKCTICQTNDSVLDVHHIDKNKDNCHPSNLITLCRSCHRRVDGGSLQLGDSSWLDTNQLHILI